MQASHGKTSQVPKYSKQLQTAVHDDARRRAIDAAKKRAAAQNVDYPTFAALVSMAHVKPFERKRGQEVSVQRIVPSPAWSFDATGKLVCSRETSGEPNILQKSVEHGVDSSLHPLKWEKSAGPEQEIRTSQETSDLPDAQGFIHMEHHLITPDAFKREWKRSTELHDKLQLLLAASGNLFHIFKVELPPSLLTDIVNVLCWWKQWSTLEKPNVSTPSCPEEAVTKSTDKNPGIGAFDVNLACCILESLVKCGRFSLSLKLAGPKLLQSALGLFNDILSSLGTKASCNGESTCSSHTDKCVRVNERNCIADQYILIDRIRSLKSIYTVEF